MIQPYVYRLDHPFTGEFYIGFRSANKVPAHEDLGHKYFTSSKKVKSRFHEFDITMILKCDDAQEAYDLEQFLIWADWKKPGMINKHHHYGKGKFNCTGHSDDSRTRMSDSHKGLLHSDETKAKFKERKWSDETKAKISASNKGKTRSDETKAKISAAKIGNPRSAETRAKISASIKRRHELNNK